MAEFHGESAENGRAKTWAATWATVGAARVAGGAAVGLAGAVGAAVEPSGGLVAGLVAGAVEAGGRLVVAGALVATLVEVHVAVVAGPSGTPLAGAVRSRSDPGLAASHGAPRWGDDERLLTTAIATTTTAKAPAS